ncbi:MAG: hypothetical protein UCI02_04565, partial [Bifidobacterium criceti]|nr:hypothetical protein [Bifidobacterium criceti]
MPEQAHNTSEVVTPPHGNHPHCGTLRDRPPYHSADWPACAQPAGHEDGIVTRVGDNVRIAEAHGKNARLVISAGSMRLLWTYTSVDQTMRRHAAEDGLRTATPTRQTSKRSRNMLDGF